MKNKYLGSVYLTVAASIWGGMYVVSKVVLTVIGPFERNQLCPCGSGKKFKKCCGGTL